MTTKTEAELEAAQLVVTNLQLRKAAEEAIFAANTENMRELAIALHELLCTTSNCTWTQSPTPNNANSADWLEKAHALWLKRAQLGVGKMRELGFIVTDPDEVAP